MMKTIHLTALAFLVLAWLNPIQAEDVARIAGTVLDENGRGIPGVSVGLFDQATGQPIIAGTGQRLGEVLARSQEQDALRQWWVVVTDEAGQFAFEGVAAGTYRVVGQSWEPVPGEDDAEGVVEGDVWGRRGSVLRLRGAANGVIIPSPEATLLTLRPFGTGSLSLEEKNGNGGWVAVLSTAPLAGDPALYLLAWDARFLSSAIATNHGPTHRPMTYHGLPDGEVHVAMFFYDNRPGSAAGTATIRADETATLRPHAIAGWSDGRKDPPPSLAPLTEKLTATQWQLEHLLGDLPDEVRRRRDFGSGVLQAWGPLDRRVQLPDGSTETVADLIAAATYRDLQKFKH